MHCFKASLFFVAGLVFSPGFESLVLVSAVLVSVSFFPVSLSAAFFSLSLAFL